MRMPVVRRWAYTGALVGAGVSIAANVLHSYVPPAGVATPWSPATGAVVGAIFWPVALLIAVEIFARWHPDARRFKALRWLGLVPVAVVAAVVSYRHMSGLLDFWHEDPVTVMIGPLAVDGIMVMAAGCLIATSPAGAPAVRGPAVSLVKDPVVRLARTLGLPAQTPLPVLVEHERIQARLAGALDAMATTPTGKPAGVAAAERRRPALVVPPAERASAVKVREARAAAPTATQQEIADASGISLRTVARYWRVTMPSANGTEVAAGHGP